VILQKFPIQAGQLLANEGSEWRPIAMKTPVKPIPDGYRTLTPYLTVENVDKLLEFMKRAFDAQETQRMTRPDGTIRHAEARIGDSVVMVGGVPGTSKAKPATLYLYVPDVDATYRRAIAAGGTSLREPTDEFYGDRSSGVEDPVGNQWWIATHIEDVSSEELKRRAAQQTPR
jgi:PhnB protein